MKVISRLVILVRFILNTETGFNWSISVWPTQDLDLEINFRHRNSDPRNTRFENSILHENLSWLVITSD